MVLFCTAIILIPQALWSVQCCQFFSDLRILQLSAYDMILGMDWLEAYSPMKVHWTQEWLAIPYEASTMVVYGSLPDLPEATVVQVCSVQVIADDSVVVQLYCRDPKVG